MKSVQMPCPKEDREQQTVIEWASWQEAAHPELLNLYAIPNGSKRTKGHGGKLVGQGMKAGVPDLCLAWPAEVNGVQYHGLYVEMKRVRGGRVEPEQRDWLNRLDKAGYLALVAKGAGEAIGIIQEYLGIK